MAPILVFVLVVLLVCNRRGGNAVLSSTGSYRHRAATVATASIYDKAPLFPARPSSAALRQPARVECQSRASEAKSPGGLFHCRAARKNTLAEGPDDGATREPREARGRIGGIVARGPVLLHEGDVLWHIPGSARNPGRAAPAGGSGASRRRVGGESEASRGRVGEGGPREEHVALHAEGSCAVGDASGECKKKKTETGRGLAVAKLELENLLRNSKIRFPSHFAAAESQRSTLCGSRVKFDGVTGDREVGGWGGGGGSRQTRLALATPRAAKKIFCLSAEASESVKSQSSCAHKSGISFASRRFPLESIDAVDFEDFEAHLEEEALVRASRRPAFHAWPVRPYESDRRHLLVVAGRFSKFPDKVARVNPADVKGRARFCFFSGNRGRSGAQSCERAEDVDAMSNRGHVEGADKWGIDVSEAVPGV
ncbi:hypothetical protein KM043_007340 [Ampulex compressa]|nr:hypothetical protein KM043_007340 [Ampulex compressa]